MVLVWSELACADNQATALMVAINSLFQIIAYSLLGWLYLTGLPSLLGLDTQGFEVSVWEVARTVLVFLGIPLAAGYVTRRVGVSRRDVQWYEEEFLPRIGPLALYGLLFTIVMLFALQGDAITAQPLDVALIAVPLLVYFVVMFGVSFALGWRMGLGYARTASLAFTAASNNFELGDRRGGRRLRRHLGAGAGRGGRPAHRGARARRPGLRGAVGRPARVRSRGGPTQPDRGGAAAGESGGGVSTVLFVCAANAGRFTSSVAAEGLSCARGVRRPR
jgi:sodium bile acid symporter family protein